jgi:hypothetical protein
MGWSNISASPHARLPMSWGDLYLLFINYAMNHIKSHCHFFGFSAFNFLQRIRNFINFNAIHSNRLENKFAEQVSVA